MMKILVRMVPAAALLLMLTGCGMSEDAFENLFEGAVKAFTGISYDVDEQSITISVPTEEGETVTYSTAADRLPKGFPLPLYPGAVVASAGELSRDGSSFAMAEIAFSAGLDQVADYYEAALRELGVSEITRSDGEKDEGPTIVVRGKLQEKTVSIGLVFDKADQTGKGVLMYGDLTALTGE